MPKYKVQLKQGKRTIVSHIEAKSVDDVLQFYNAVSTMRVSEILKVEYSNNSIPPVDDYIYQSLFKGIIKNEELRISKQIILHNIKNSVSENDIYNACQTHLEIRGSKVDAVSCTLFKD